MLTYRFGPVAVSVTLDDPAPMQTWLSHLLPPISALHGDDADAEIDSIKALAATILATPGRAYGETLHGAVLDLRYPDLFTIAAPEPAQPTAGTRGGPSDTDDGSGDRRSPRLVEDPPPIPVTPPGTAGQPPTSPPEAEVYRHRDRMDSRTAGSRPSPSTSHRSVRSRLVSHAPATEPSPPVDRSPG